LRAGLIALDYPKTPASHLRIAEREAGPGAADPPAASHVRAARQEICDLQRNL
jgi:hypothetical protein